MAFDTTSVSVGAPTKKADYDRLMDNTKYILSSATAFTGNKSHSGIWNITNTTESTSGTTGALKVAGGVGIAKRLNVTGNTYLSGTLGVLGIASLLNTTESSAYNNGSVILSGGLGVAKKIYTNSLVVVGGASGITLSSTYISSAGLLDLKSSGTVRMRIASGGNVAIGTDTALVHATAGYYLQIKENSSALAYAQFTNDTTDHAASNGLVIGIDANEDGVITNYTSGADILINTTGAGNIGLFTSTPYVFSGYSAIDIANVCSIMFGSGELYLLNNMYYNSGSWKRSSGTTVIPSHITFANGAISIVQSSSTGAENAVISDLAVPFTIGAGSLSNALVTTATGVTMAGTLGVTGNSTLASLDVGGGYGSTGITLSAAGVLQMNGALTVDGASTLVGTVTIGGGYGSTGITLSDAGVLQMNGALTVDGTGTFTGGRVITGGTVLEKIIEIGDWDMYVSGSGSSSINVAHGLGASWVNIRSISVVVRNDADTIYHTTLVLTYSLWIVRFTSTNIELDSAGFFDTSSYESTSYNRGWIYITYEV